LVNKLKLKFPGSSWIGAEELLGRAESVLNFRFEQTTTAAATTAATTTTNAPFENQRDVAIQSLVLRNALQVYYY